MSPVSDEPMRLDKWLWVARLTKSRAIAAEAIKGGRVHVNGRAAKPSRDVGPGDRLELSIRLPRMHLVVLATAPRRGPAAEAALLYEETAESRAERERQAEERRLVAPDPVRSGAGRPTKRDRRRYNSLSGRSGSR